MIGLLVALALVGGVTYRALRRARPWNWRDIGPIRVIDDQDSADRLWRQHTIIERIGLSTIDPGAIVRLVGV